MNNTCFICCLPRTHFDNKAVSFDEHIKTEHNMWHYLYFMVLIKVKDPTEYTGECVGQELVLIFFLLIDADSRVLHYKMNQILEKILLERLYLHIYSSDIGKT